ncbi:arginine N-succinyltransferase [Chitinimonas sp. BJB300]|uniref:arginine N-succinyltransferase n=1 Tax=Chitinimonas sp. BJB300 TaxID=1559339 RepID=UPI000C0DD77C|nr:arginine N-succinyltransferase [Chitinimonas sp. BJB300]PHV11754.1 arginine N-succinyltransferase [Chitinimonas sp. BJB300]TSJ87108.1 arginine N-succinyltransferase [Chitinimonas sp. BJB300]
MRVRSIRRDDLAALIQLARSTGVGVTTLPVNEERLSRRIEGSLAAAAGPVNPADSSFVFVLEDDEQAGHVAGICGIEGAVGATEPWYNYRVGLSVHSSREIGVYRKLDTLFLTNDLTGRAELCSLFLQPEYRRDSNGSLLSKSRFLFMAEFPERFDSQVIAEMRGVSDDAGYSPFWESLGRHFFKMEFSEADYLTGIGQKAFIAELMPQHPVYAAFLSEAARAVIGQVHDNTKPALAMLESEGFRYNHYVDIFDAGPTIECTLSDIRAVRESKTYTAKPEDTTAGRSWLVANRQLEDFRVCLAQTEPTPAGLPLARDIIERLGIEPGASVRAVLLSTRG